MTSEDRILEDLQEIKDILQTDTPERHSVLTRLFLLEKYAEDNSNRKSVTMSRGWTLVVVLITAIITAFADNVLPRILG